MSNYTDLDTWTIGSLHKDVIWGYYVSANYLGVGLCAMLMISTKRSSNGAPSASLDTLMGGLASACLWMSATCGSQCLVSLIYKYFYGGTIACKLEAFFHISAILAQFLHVTAISGRAYLVVVKRYTMTVKQARGVVVAIWSLCIAITYGLSYVSPIYLMSAGTYCFFGFS